LDEQSFNLHGTFTVEPTLGHNPEIMCPFDQMPIYPEKFFHLSLYIIALHRIPDLPVNRNGESMVCKVIL
jgi:hypothetical protein